MTRTQVAFQHTCCRARGDVNTRSMGIDILRVRSINDVHPAICQCLHIALKSPGVAVKVLSWAKLLRVHENRYNRFEPGASHLLDQ